jgi:predicted RNA-binding protein YlxR (DUF448 family)/ribosomal protein L30E
MNDSKKGPERTCLACRTQFEKKSLLRFVLAPDGSLLIDYRQRLPGRGAYTCMNLKCVNDAVKKGGFKRAFKGRCGNVNADELIAQLQNEVRQRILNLLGIARKSGNIATGSNATLDALRGKAKVGLVLLAVDISEGVGEKVINAAKKEAVAVYCLFDKLMIGQHLGKNEVSAVAFSDNDLSASMLKELCRYEQLVREN